MHYWGRQQTVQASKRPPRGAFLLTSILNLPTFSIYPAVSQAQKSGFVSLQQLILLSWNQIPYVLLCGENENVQSQGSGTHTGTTSTFVPCLQPHCWDVLSHTPKAVQ